MKSVFAVMLLVSLFVQRGSGQITIGPEKLPAVGDVHVTMPMDTTGVQEGSAGGNKVWNFSSLQPTGPTLTLNYVLPSNTPYGQEFPIATVASRIEDGEFVTYSYFTTTSGRLTSWGSAGEEFRITYQDPEVQMITPLQFNDQYTDQFYGSMNGDGFQVRTRGSITVINDSYGTITLPDGRTSVAARVKFIRQNFDTTFVNGFPFMTSSMTITSYEWFLPTVKFPVLQIAYYVQTTNGNTSTIKKVEFNPSQPTSVGDRAGEGLVKSFTLHQNYPNPFNPSTTISFSLVKGGKVQLKVFSLLGEEVATLVNDELSTGMYAIPFDASGLASGTYIYRLQVGNEIQTRKLTLLK